VEKSALLTRIRKGDQARLDIVAVAKELTLAFKECAPVSNELPRILFDWSEVTSLPYQTPSQKSLQVWRKTAPQVLRAAFVHHRRWDRQVALLAALLRSADAEVRSFSPEHLDDAVGWLVGAREAIGREDEATASSVLRGEVQFSVRVADRSTRSRDLTGK
jgi:hypothetical protein